MATAKIQTLKPFTIRNASTGALFSPAKGAIIEVDDSVATALIADGLAQTYTLVEPTGTKLINENGLVNVATYEKAQVVVPGPTGNVELTENGTGIDIAQYATATVAVPNPSTGTLEITAEGTYDVTNYASVHVAIAAATEGEGGAE